MWYLEGNPRLSIGAKAIVDDPHSELVLPLIALAEAVFIVERGRTSIRSVSELLLSVQSDSRVAIYPLTWAVFQQSLAARVIPELHDRLIVATALHLQSLGHGVSLVTKDSAITDAALVSVLW